MRQTSKFEPAVRGIPNTVLSPPISLEVSGLPPRGGSYVQAAGGIDTPNPARMSLVSRNSVIPSVGVGVGAGHGIGSSNSGIRVVRQSIIEINGIGMNEVGTQVVPSSETGELLSNRGSGLQNWANKVTSLTRLSGGSRKLRTSAKRKASAKRNKAATRESSFEKKDPMDTSSANGNVDDHAGIRDSLKAGLDVLSSWLPGSAASASMHPAGGEGRKLEKHRPLDSETDIVIRLVNKMVQKSRFMILGFFP